MPDATLGPLKPANPGNDGRDEARPPIMPFYHMWTGPDGHSRLDRCEMTGFALQSVGGGAAPQWMHDFPGDVTAVKFNVLPKGWIGEWHPPIVGIVTSRKRTASNCAYDRCESASQPGWHDADSRVDCASRSLSSVCKETSCKGWVSECSSRAVQRTSGSRPRPRSSRSSRSWSCGSRPSWCGCPCWCCRPTTRCADRSSDCGTGRQLSCT